MSFDAVEKTDELFKQKNYVKSREATTLEFQYRIFDLVLSEKTPFMEKLNFIKIILSNLEEFISIRLPLVSEKTILIHDIEELYSKVADSIQKLTGITLDNSVKAYKKIYHQDLNYVYTGGSKETVKSELTEYVTMKQDLKFFDILYSGEIIDLENLINIIHVDKIIIEFDNIYDRYKNQFKADPSKYYPKMVPNYHQYDYYFHLTRRDILIHNPYDSYQMVLDFINQMCVHPNITTIFVSLYRTAKDSKIIKALLLAKKLNKNVMVYIEPTARGNEEDNLKNIQTLQKAGVNVSYNYYNYKVHGKIFCAISKDFKKFAHIGTGNYNEDTAKCYTDFHLLTSNELICTEIVKLFMSFFDMKTYHSLSKYPLVYASPFNVRSKIYSLINTEIRKGRKGRITIKCNNLCDSAIINKLYSAADAGVKVRIICRTACSILPRENLIVKSKVGQFLEHDRYYIFGDRVYIASADLLLRNLSKRVEVMCEITSKANKEKIKLAFLSLWCGKSIHELNQTGEWILRELEG